MNGAAGAQKPPNTKQIHLPRRRDWAIPDHKLGRSKESASPRPRPHQPSLKCGWAACSNCAASCVRVIWSCTPVQMLWQWICEDTWFRYGIPASPAEAHQLNWILSRKRIQFRMMSLLDMEANTSFILLTSLYIAKKTVLMNWKPKNCLCVHLYRILLHDQINQEETFAFSKNQWLCFSLVPTDQLHHLVGVGGCIFFFWSIYCCKLVLSLSERCLC